MTIETPTFIYFTEALINSVYCLGWLFLHPTASLKSQNSAAISSILFLAGCKTILPIRHTSFNQCFPKHGAVMKYGIIDLGSNTIRLAVYHAQNGMPVCLFTRKVFARAVSYRRFDIMLPEGISVITRALRELCGHASYHDLTSLWCFATACLRGLKNQSDVLTAIKDETDLVAEVLTGEQEAAYGVNGLTFSSNIRDALCIDLGGGSCEISLVKNRETVHSISVDIGSVSAYKDHVKGIFPDQNEIKDITKSVLHALNGLSWLKDSRMDIALAIGGSARAMCRIHRALYHPDASLDAYSIETCEMAPLYQKLCTMQLNGIRLADQHCPGRIFTLIPGIVILREVMAFAGAQRLRLASAGVREGYLFSKLGLA
jgi:exopolyphosphatase/guanosine-5'-triphosphate,3'-diphosphate pyrophosphatase